jgi:hypothetical protein
MKKPFKIGDDVAVYNNYSLSRQTGVIREVTEGGKFSVEIRDAHGCKGFALVFPQQCRHLKKKKKVKAIDLLLDKAAARITWDCVTDEALTRLYVSIVERVGFERGLRTAIRLIEERAQEAKSEDVVAGMAIAEIAIRERLHRLINNSQYQKDKESL